MRPCECGHVRCKFFPSFILDVRAHAGLVQRTHRLFIGIRPSTVLVRLTKPSSIQYPWSFTDKVTVSWAISKPTALTLTSEGVDGMLFRRSAINNSEAKAFGWVSACICVVSKFDWIAIFHYRFFSLQIQTKKKHWWYYWVGQNLRCDDFFHILYFTRNWCAHL